jgi:DNA polymerase I-like protein with 3'-5' exonuclease and polymerase domains
VPRGSNKVWNGNAKSSFNSGREGYILYGWDYSQIELRLATAYGQEQILLTEFENPNADPFNVLAPLIFGELTPETRHETKTFVYANLYGAGVNKIALQLGRPVHEVEELYGNYKRSISGIIDVSQQVTRLVEQRKFVKYWDGRRRHIRSRSDAYKAWNSVCQGGAAQLVKKAMLRCLEFEDENCFMVLTVHDEITFVIRENMIDHYEPLIIEAMTDWPQFGVNLHVEGKEWK